MHKINSFKTICNCIFFLAISHCFAQNYAPNGNIFTPKGDLRVLIIYAGFSGYDSNQPLGDWPASSDLPTYNSLDIAYSNYDEFDKHSNNPLINNLSKFYYEMSMGQFRIVADVLPTRINIDPTGLQGWSSCNRAVINKMQKEYPNFNWEPYDKRKNRPHYISDNSISAPDGKPDYVIIAYRYSDGWSVQPKVGMKNWIGSGGGYSVLDGTQDISYNGVQFDNAGFTQCNFSGQSKSFLSTFYHELAHELYSCPHYNGCSNTIGQYFYQPSFDYGMMQWGGGISINSANAWERWVLGWKDIKYDLSNYHQNGTYSLKDYITTGDVIRIKVPNTNNQYLWIENHQKYSIYDHNPWARQLINDPPGSDGLPDIETGIYMYVENILDDKSKISTSMVTDITKVNGIKFLNASGNFDYDKPTQFTKNGWQNKLYHYQRREPNPISGINAYFAFRHDFDNNGYIHDTSNFNKSKSESWPIACEIVNDTPQFFYARWGGRNQNAIKAGRRSDAFQVGDTISIGSNPPIVNHQKYSSKLNRLEPVYLNGLYIRIISIKNGEISMEIKFNETDILKDVRWSGDIILSDVPGVASSYDLNIKSRTTLTLNKSEIPNRLTLFEGDFINPTTFTIANGAKMHLEPYSKINIDGSKIIIEAGGILELESHSSIVATNKSEIIVKKGATLILHKQSKIKSINRSKLVTESGANVLKKK